MTNTQLTLCIDNRRLTLPVTRYQLKTGTITLIIKEPTPHTPTCGSLEKALPILEAIYEQLDADQEHFIVLCLNNRNKITGYKVVSAGGQSSTAVDPKIVFRFALLFGAAAIIISHNHPGGVAAPSQEDLTITRQLKLAADALDIALHDHIIIEPSGRWYSFNQHNKL